MYENSRSLSGLTSFYIQKNPKWNWLVIRRKKASERERERDNIKANQKCKTCRQLFVDQTHTLLLIINWSNSITTTCHPQMVEKANLSLLMKSLINRIRSVFAVYEAFLCQTRLMVRFWFWIDKRRLAMWINLPSNPVTLDMKMANLALMLSCPEFNNNNHHRRRRRQIGFNWSYTQSI